MKNLTEELIDTFIEQLIFYLNIFGSQCELYSVLP